MARVTVEDCILKVPNRFELVLLAAQRARNISRGAEILVDRDNDKNPVVALREIAEGLIDLSALEADLVKSLQRAPEPEPADEEVLDLIATDENIFGVMDVNEEPLPEAGGGSEELSPEEIEAAIAAELGGGNGGTAGR
ncbi:hypothetical protein GCM10010964_11940 [Caldovatus sediminis]|uniref:DNA-directed RNA polymerase subunit omega n=1 Tax=Caldovatus sediminis TaxID=2041189 RepID=A0A8J2Z9R4_9PROT|nr:DNA-directed RNA polymerase subunit omega [Caldovatus sediminis]GGG25599.1 hypothetical protein GCM10010964_11940 [Caldovatus sediminis]